MARATQLLCRPTLPDDDAIHDARQCLTRARATLRLLRPAIGDARYRRANGALRRLAGESRVLRDARVLVDTLEDLQARLPAAAMPAARLLRSALALDYRAARRAYPRDAASLASRRETLALMRRQVATWSGWPARAKAARSALLHTYARGRAAARALARQASDRSLHDWRKLARCLELQSRLLAPMPSARPERLHRQAQDLAQRLGADHDLALLLQRLRRLGRQRRGPDSVRELQSVLQERRARLQGACRARGERLYRRGARATRRGFRS